ncbi:hypothetical protein R83H12_02893 [Fibrobacteria bacterium R8-3-H12]
MQRDNERVRKPLPPDQSTKPSECVLKGKDAGSRNVRGRFSLVWTAMFTMSILVIGFFVYLCAQTVASRPMSTTVRGSIRFTLF